jgi:chromosomal replication initiation ATPase DnaA
MTVRKKRSNAELVDIRIKSVLLRRQGYTLMEIGKMFGYKDHTTVRNFIHSHSSWYDTDAAYRARFEIWQNNIHKLIAS